MRIIAGTFRGTQLAEVGAGDAAAHLRPTADRVRESLFNLLAGGRFGDPLRGARVLDLFAGTGALGCEALSRGADHVTFVENGRAGQALIRQNIARLRCANACTLLAADATQLPAAPQPATLAFLDPPYGQGLGERALASAAAQGWLAPGALVVWEDNAAQPAPPGFAPRDSRRYGKTWITLLEHGA